MKVELRLIKQQKRRQSGGMMEGMEEKKSSEDHLFIHHNQQRSHLGQGYPSEETKSVFPVSPKVEEISSTVQ